MSDARVYIVAEAGVNHNGSIDMAKRLVDIAVEAGTDAVKFQTFKTGKVVQQTAPKADYQFDRASSEESQYELLKHLELDERSHRELVRHCKERGIQFLSSPFDFESLDLLVDELDVTRLKLGSGEITNAPLLLKAAQTGKPIILSTGMATLGEIEAALGVFAFGYLQIAEQPSRQGFQAAFCSEKGQAVLREHVTLLHCTTEYPAPLEDVNLRAIDTLRSAFGLRVGYSDHTPGVTIPAAAVARGAVVVEKHFTVDRGLPGPDHQASLEPDELKAMVKSIRDVELALGSGQKIPAPSELKNRAVARRSLVAARKISAGDKFTETNLTAKRPGRSLSPFYYWDYLGKKAERFYPPDEPIDP